jgi:hypothetical protein
LGSSDDSVGGKYDHRRQQLLVSHLVLNLERHLFIKIGDSYMQVRQWVAFSSN